MHAKYRFRFSEEHLLTSFLRDRQQSLWHRTLHRWRWIVAGALVLAAFSAIYRGEPALAALYGGAMAMIVLGWPIEAWSIRRQFRRSPFHNDEITLALNENGFHAVGLNSEVRIGWDSFTKARRVQDGLLLYQGPGVFNWLPDSAAVDAAALAHAHEVVRAQVKDYQGA